MGVWSSRTPTALDTAPAIAASGGEAAAFAVDVSQAESVQAMIEQCLAAGANGSIDKPFEPIQLLEQMLKVFSADINLIDHA